MSARWLARPDARVLATLGTGSVDEGTLATRDTVSPWQVVRVWSRSQASVDRFLASEAPRYPHLSLRGTTDVRTAVERADDDLDAEERRPWAASVVPRGPPFPYRELRRRAAFGFAAGVE